MYITRICIYSHVSTVSAKKKKSHTDRERNPHTLERYSNPATMPDFVFK
jgi:hypothetical protein